MRFLKRKASVRGHRFGGERERVNSGCRIDLWDKEASNIGTVYEICMKKGNKKTFAVENQISLSTFSFSSKKSPLNQIYVEYKITWD